MPESTFCVTIVHIEVTAYHEAGHVFMAIYLGARVRSVTIDGFVAEWAADWREAWEAAAGVVPDQRQRLAYLEQATSQLSRLLNRDNNWAALAAVTDELLAHEMLEGEAVEEIVGQWLR